MTLSNETKHLYCAVPWVEERKISSTLDSRAAAYVRSLGNTWVDGTNLHYCFFDHTRGFSSPQEWTGNDADKQVVRQGFQEWKDLGIGLDFEEVDNPQSAEIRIGFLSGDGSWSYVGKYALQIALNQRTMNFGWDLGDAYGLTTAIHEIGHAIGLQHEHQNPKSGIQWNVEEVYKDLSGHPNHWSIKTIDQNILDKLPTFDIQGSTWDPDSIMHYSFDAKLIKGPQPYDRTGIHPQGNLSQKDIDFARKVYPPLGSGDYIPLKPYRSQPATLSPGEQVNFIIVAEFSRSYNFQVLGSAETVMVLFEEIDGKPRYLYGDDDGGEERNAQIKVQLLGGHKYILRVRLYASHGSGDIGVAMW